MAVSGDDRAATPQPPLGFPSAQMHHMRHGSTASQSPPVNNGMFPPQHRMSTPQPQYPSRPTSVNSHRRISSNLVPQNHPNPQASQPQGFGYANLQQHPSYYQQARPGMQMNPNQVTPPMQQSQMNYQMLAQGYPQPVAPANQMQNLYLQDQRRQSMPPNYGIQQGRPQSVPPLQQSPPQISKPFQSPPMPGSPRQLAAPAQNSHSYSSYMNNINNNAQQWSISQQQALTSEYKPDRRSLHSPRAASIDVGAVNRQRAVSAEPRPPFAPPGIIQRAKSPLNNENYQSPQASPNFHPNAASRVNSMASDAKRPRLAIQIPTGSAEEPQSGGLESSPEQSRSSAQASTSTPTKTAISVGGASSHSNKSSIVLPPPSPSQGSSSNANPNPLSAGATGPPNPFARPPPPASQHPQPHAINTNLSPPNAALNLNTKFEANAENSTPVSALPSRFMSNELLPSPGALFGNNGDWNMSGLWSSGGMSAGGMNGFTSPNTLFQPTPVRETSGYAWLARDAGAEAAVKNEVPGRMEVDAKAEVGSEGRRSEEAEEQRMKRKIISPTEGTDDRMKRGHWVAER